MQRVRAKVCGITRPQDALTAITAGADAIGVILHAESPRLVSKTLAQSIRAVVPPFVTLVGVVVDGSVEEVQTLYHEIGLDLVQLHGSESFEYASELALPYIRAIRARSAAQVAEEMNSHKTAQAFLLDPYVKGLHGGTGRVLAAHLWPPSSDRPLILAGGLGPNNIASAVTRIRPFAVDLNSGLESSPGIKSGSKISAAFDELAATWQSDDSE